MIKEARGSFFGRGVEVLKLQSRIEDQFRSPSYYIIISTYDQSQFSHPVEMKRQSVKFYFGRDIGKRCGNK